jgi:hypothetical protein
LRNRAITLPRRQPLGKIGSCADYLGDMSNALRPDLMTAAERLDEIADILAAGLTRLRARKSSPLSDAPRESSLDFSPHQRGHANALNTPGGLD